MLRLANHRTFRGFLAYVEGLVRSELDTPFGPLSLTVNGGGELVEILLPNRTRAVTPSRFVSPQAATGMRDAARQLTEYFQGARRAFELPLRPAGSAFEQQVWERLLAVPYGITTSYGAIALQLGLSNGARAVGRANGANPIPIVIPCHRIIGSDGQLTGYGGGLPLKRALLELEGALPCRQIDLFA